MSSVISALQQVDDIRSRAIEVLYVIHVYDVL